MESPAGLMPVPAPDPTSLLGRRVQFNFRIAPVQLATDCIPMVTAGKTKRPRLFCRMEGPIAVLARSGLVSSLGVPMPYPPPAGLVLLRWRLDIPLAGAHLCRPRGRIVIGFGQLHERGHPTKPREERGGATSQGG